jgi:hypothetical protein
MDNGQWTIDNENQAENLWLAGCSIFSLPIVYCTLSIKKPGLTVVKTGPGQRRN